MGDAVSVSDKQLAKLNEGVIPDSINIRDLYNVDWAIVDEIINKHSYLSKNIMAKKITEKDAEGIISKIYKKNYHRIHKTINWRSFVSHVAIIGIVIPVCFYLYSIWK